MRLFSGLLISTLALGTIVTTGCAEHRYRGNDPYYGSGGYYGYNDPYYREWLAERRYDNIEYNRLSRERQREYWEWRRQNEARFRNDPRFRDRVRNDHDADDRRRNDHDADDRDNRRFPGNQRAVVNDHDRDDRGNGGRQVARERDGDRDRHKADRNRHDVRDRDHNRSHDKDRDHDRDHDHDRR
jgi:zinc finger CCCH domain-containing protein 13